MSSKKDCIDAKFVPCEKARDYLKKHGRLCGIAPADTAEKPIAHKPKPKTNRKKGFFERWLG